MPASYESTAWSLIRQRVGRELGILQVLPNARITSVAAGSVTAPDFFQDSGAGTGSFNRYGLYRPTSATVADNWRLLGDLGAAGLVNQRGLNYADTTLGTEDMELWDYAQAARPDLDWYDAVNQVLKEEYFTQTLALSHLSIYDGDMQKSTDTDWTDIGSPGTSAKATTDIRTSWGPRSYHLINSAANEGTRSTAIPITANRRFCAFAIASTNVGTSQFQVYDATNSGLIGMPDALSSNEQQSQLFEMRFKIGAPTARKLALNLTNTSASGDTYWDQAWLYRVDDYKINFPSYISEGFKVDKILRGRPRYVTTNQVWDAGSIVMEPLVEGVDYELMFQHGDANPYAALFSGDFAFEWPLFVQVRRPFFDIVASGAGFSADTDTFPGPTKTFIARLKKELLERIYMSKVKNNGSFTRLYQEATAELRAAEFARPQESPAKALPYYGGIGRRM